MEHRRSVRILYFSDNWETLYARDSLVDILNKKTTTEVEVISEESIGDSLPSPVHHCDKDKFPKDSVKRAVKHLFDTTTFDAVVIAHFGGRGLERLKLVPRELLSRTIIVWSQRQEQRMKEKRAIYAQYQGVVNHFVTRDHLCYRLCEVLEL